MEYTKGFVELKFRTNKSKYVVNLEKKKNSIKYRLYCTSRDIFYTFSPHSSSVSLFDSQYSIELALLLSILERHEIGKSLLKSEVANKKAWKRAERSFFIYREVK